MRGVSGSGKSTVARQIANEPGSIIVSADDALKTPDGGYEWSVERIGPAHQQCFRLFMAAIEAGAELIVVDNTNAKAFEISPYMLAAGAFGYEAAIVEVRCDPKVAAARNTHNTPLPVIERMVARMKTEQLAPWWNVIHVDTGVEEAGGDNETPG
jgi:predicted kinase